MAGKDDEFDEWLDDIDGGDSDLDQDNIDELLSAVESDTDAVADQSNEAKGSGELDQDNIDALLGLSSSDTDSSESGELDQDNIDELLSGTGYDADASEDFNLDELEQDNIDALLAGSVDSDTSDADEDLAELAQDNIDALLAGSSKDAAPEEESQAELDQSDIDSLLSTKPESTEAEDDFDDLDALFADDVEESEAAAPLAASPEPEPEEDFGDLDQDNIDALFNDIDAASPPEALTAPTEEEDLGLDELFAADDEAEQAPPAVSAEQVSDELSPEDADELASSAFDSELDEMDQLFADIDSDTEDEDPFLAEEIDFAEMLGQTEGDDQEFIELDTADTKAPETTADDFMAQAGAEDDSDIEAITSDEDKEKKARGLMIPAALAGMNKSVLTGIGGGLALLLLLGLYFLFSGPEESTDTIKEASVSEQQVPARKMVENFIPATENALYDMGDKGGELSIELSAVDKDDQPLIYEITSQPRHGRLSGTAPLLTYLPDTTFPGEDRFEFKVSDGTDTSDIAVITITGPDLMTLAKKEAEKKKEKAEKKIFKPQKPKVLAKDVKYFTISTGAVTIDWARLGQEANSSPYTSKEVHVEIVDTTMKGSLTRRDRTSHTFIPDPYVASTDTIRYRFKKGGFRSATKTIAINVELGSPAPQINIAELGDGYKVGQNVVIDASASRDEARENLKFFWEQVSGVPIDLHLLNEEGSKIAFTMPSSFYSDPNPGPTLAVTALDNTGKEVRQEIKVKMVSRRQTALWRGDNGHVAPEPPMQGRYFPWPFDD